MLKRDINFFDCIDTIVEFELEGNTVTGRLQVENSKLSVITLTDRFRFYDVQSLDLPDDKLRCKDLDNGSLFTLHNIMWNRGIIQAEYLTTGHDAESVEKIQISLTGLSVWMEGSRGFKFVNDELRRDISVDKFSTPFRFKGTKYLIENSIDCSTERQDSSTHRVTIAHTILITKVGAGFSLSEAKNIALEVKRLFSLLIGRELSIENLWLLPKNRAKYQAFHFTSFNAEKNPLSNWLDATCRFHTITGWGLWPKIITNYFTLNEFRNIWGRLVSSYNHKGLCWDHQIFSCVVILEMYCKKKSSGKGIKLDVNKLDEIKKNLNDTITLSISDSEFTAEDIEVLNGFKVAISNIKNTTHPTLKQKYEYVMHSISAGVKAAINFSDDDFIRMKKIRDCVAHGSEYRSAIHGDISIEMQLKDRLLILLTYLSYKNLGLTDQQIGQFFQASFNPFLRNGKCDGRELDKLVGDAPFITLSEEFSLENIPNSHSLVVKKFNESYTVDVVLTNALISDPRWGGHKDIRDFIKSFLAPGQRFQLDFVSTAYITSSGYERPFYGMILLTSEDREIELNAE